MAMGATVFRIRIELIFVPLLESDHTSAVTGRHAIIEDDDG
jgi:hypothetical protein